MINAIQNLKKYVLKKLANRMGQMTGPKTPLKKLVNLIHSLRPVETGCPLIRLGPNSDGGYLVPDDMEDLLACFSPGVGNICGFESDCLARGIRVFLADGTVSQIPKELPGASFIPKNLGVLNTSHEMTIDKWVDESGLPSTGDLILQMDIEGSEWPVLANISESLLQRMRIIVVEFHSLDQLWNYPFFLIASAVFSRLLANHYCVHLHPNNCRQPYWSGKIGIPPIMEFTFYRKDRGSPLGSKLNFPHPLDCNNLARPPVILPDCWYAGKPDLD